MKNYHVFIGTILFSYNPNKAKTSKMWLYELESRKELIRQENFKSDCGDSRGCPGSTGLLVGVWGHFLRRARRGWTCRVLRRPEVIACLSRTIPCAVAVGLDARLGSLVGGEGGRKQKREKKNNPKRTNGNRWRRPHAGSRGGGTAMPGPLLTVECFSSLRSQKFSMEVVSLTSVCLGPKDRGNGVGRIK